MYTIFVINPGSTSTKLSLHQDDTCVFSTDVFHDSAILKTYETINDQLNYRMQVVEEFLKEHKIDLNTVDMIVGRGGGCYPIPGGIYAITEELIQDTREAKGGLYHASMLGVQMADLLAKRYHKKAIMMDPPVVDELQEVARGTVVKGVTRRAVSHALNLKAVAKTHAKKMGKKYEECNFIVSHIDGGISVTAHCHGKMIDGNDAGGGEGPFTPTRMGSFAVTDGNSYLRNLSYEDVRSLCSQTGGLSSYFNTSNSDTVHNMVEEGDPTAKLVWDAMIYQTAKYIGSMAVVLQGKVDAIVLTGGLCRFRDVVEGIRSQCGWIAPIAIYPGEMEHEAMAAGALHILRKEEELLGYVQYRKIK